MDVPTSTTSNFSYDAIYQLTQVVQNLTTTESYSYDGVGNRLSSLGISPYAYNSSNQLTSIAGTPPTTFTYDNNGNTLTKTDASGTTTYAWDYENRLTSVTLPASGGTVSFKYDPLGRRIQKSSTSSTTVYAYDGENIIEETDAAGSAVARYSQGLGIDEPLAMVRGGATRFYHADGLGSITSLTDAAGSVAASYTYDSFGNLTASTGGVTNPFRYTAREFDPETGLYFYRARYYSPTIGRFMTEDPLGYEADANFYRFVVNSPTNLRDPSGLLAELWCERISPWGNGFWNGPIVVLSQAQHCYIRVQCQGKDETIEIYGPDGGPTGRPKRQDFSPARTGELNKFKIYPPPNMKCCEFENRLLENYERLKGQLPLYNPYPGPNSNTFVNQIILASGGFADFPYGAYGADFVREPKK